MKCHEVDYKILGHDIQLVEVELDPDETVIAKAGAMNYMEQGISFETKMGDGSTPDEGMVSKLFSAAKRKLTGESVFTTHFTHTGKASSMLHFQRQHLAVLSLLIWVKSEEAITCQKRFFFSSRFRH